MPPHRYQPIAGLQVDNERPPLLTAEERRIARLLENDHIHRSIDRTLPQGTILWEKYRRFVDLVQLRQGIDRVVIAVDTQLGEGTEEAAVIEELLTQLNHTSYLKYYDVFKQLAGPQGLVPRFPNIFVRNGRPTFVSEEFNPCSSCGFSGHFPIHCSLYSCSICHHQAPGHLPEECPHAQRTPRRDGGAHAHLNPVPTLILEAVPPPQPHSSDADDSSIEEPGPPRRRRRRSPPTTNGLLTTPAPAVTPSASSGGDQIIFPVGSPSPPPLPTRNRLRLADRISGNRATAMPQEDTSGNFAGEGELGWYLERIRPGPHVAPRNVPLILHWREGRFVDMSGNEHQHDPAGQLVYHFNRPGGAIPGLDEITIRVPDVPPLDGASQQGEDIQDSEMP